MAKNFYETLGVEKNASEAEIKSAFRKKAKEFHPDNKETGDEAKFKEIGEAYATLSDASKKGQYDQFGHEAYTDPRSGSYGGGFQGFDDIDLGSIFGDLFGGFGGFGGSRKAQRNRPTKGPDSLVRMNLSFEEAVHGCEKELKLDLNETCEECSGKGGFGETTCPNCSGSGVVITEQRTMFGMFQSRVSCSECGGSGKSFKDRCSGCRGTGHIRRNKEISVNVPAGVDSGHQLRISAKGEAGSNGGPNGDIYLEFIVGKHALFTRDENDIYLEVPLTITEAVLGCKKDVPTIYDTIRVEFDEGTGTGEMQRIKNKGIADPNTGKKGDMYITTKIVIPSKIDRKQRTLFKDLDKTDLNDAPEIKVFNKYL